MEKIWTHILCQVYTFLKIWCHIDVIFMPGNYGKYVNIQKLICSQRYESREIKQQIHWHSFCQPHYTHVLGLECALSSFCEYLYSTHRCIYRSKCVKKVRINLNIITSRTGNTCLLMSRALTLTGSVGASYVRAKACRKKIKTLSKMSVSLSTGHYFYMFSS